MNFTEHTRSKLEDGREIIYSKAYAALETYEQAANDVIESQQALTEATAKLEAAKEALKAAKTTLLDDLTDHYDSLPEAIHTTDVMFLFEEDPNGGVSVRMIQPKSYCDLYVIEPEKGGQQ